MFNRLQIYSQKSTLSSSTFYWKLKAKNYPYWRHLFYTSLLPNFTIIIKIIEVVLRTTLYETDALDAHLQSITVSSGLFTSSDSLKFTVQLVTLGSWYFSSHEVTQLFLFSSPHGQRSIGREQTKK